ncbi:adenylate kinase [Enterococcus sp. LJL128]
MIILIGGASCSGKTVLAQKLLEIYHIPYLSIDHLKMGLIGGYPECGFTPFSSDEIINEKLWPVLKKIIEVAIENEQHLIIEGCYLPQDKVHELAAAHREIVPVYLGFSEGYIRNHFEDGILAYRSTIERRKFAEDRPVQEIIAEHAETKRKCKHYQLLYLEADEKYQDMLDRAVEQTAAAINKMQETALP